MTWFKMKREELGLSQQKLADLIGVSRQMVGEYDKGSQPRPDVAKRIAKVFKVEPEVFDPVLSTVRHVDTSTEVHTISVYQLSELVVGPGGPGSMQPLKSLTGQEKLTVPPQLKNCYAVQLTDDSMSPTYNSGDIVVIDPAYPAFDGCDVLATLAAGGSIVRRYVLRGKDRSGLTVFDLSTPNPNHKTITVAGDDIASVEGVVVELRQRRAPLLPAT